MSQVRDTLQEAGNRLLRDLGLMLIRKKRRASGKLINTMTAEVTRSVNGWLLEIKMLPYWKVVNDGVPASKVPFGDSTGKKTSKYIRGLMNWLKVKGIASSVPHIKSIAFAIAKTHKKKGIPVDKNKLGFVDEIATQKRMAVILEQVKRQQIIEINAEISKILPKEIIV